MFGQWPFLFSLIPLQSIFESSDINLLVARNRLYLR